MTNQKFFKFNKSNMDQLLNDDSVVVGWEVEMIVPSSALKNVVGHLYVDKMTAVELMQYFMATIPNKASFLLESESELAKATLLKTKQAILEKCQQQYKSGLTKFIDFLSHQYMMTVPHWETLWDDRRDIINSMIDFIADHKSYDEAIDILVSILISAPSVYQSNMLDRVFVSNDLIGIFNITENIPNKFWVDKERLILTDIYKNQRNILTYANVASTLGSVLDTKIAFHNDGSSPDTLTQFCIMKDASIRGLGDRESINIEITSPPLPIRKSIETLKKLTDWMCQNKIHTNESCGLHFGISLTPKQLMKKVSPLKLILLQAETEIAYRFDRYTNIYASTHSDELAFIIHTNPELKKEVLNTRSFDELEMLLKPYISYGKYFSANLGKLHHGYVEFRTIGGPKYHTRWESILTSLALNIHALKMSVYNDVEINNGCIKRLVTLLDKFNDSEFVVDKDHKHYELFNEFVKLFPKNIGITRYLYDCIEMVTNNAGTIDSLWVLTHSMCRYSINTNDWSWLDNFQIRKFYKTFVINRQELRVYSTRMNDETATIVNTVLTEMTSAAEMVTTVNF